MNIDIIFASYVNKNHAKAIGNILNEYAKDKMGGNKELPEEIRNNIAKKLSTISNSFTVLAYVNNEPAGLITAFENFSTFKCKPLINIHDIMVLKEFRNLGLSQKMLALVQKESIKRGCCKITLEVLDKNEIAKKSYTKFGFSGYELDPQFGKALFWEKELK